MRPGSGAGAGAQATARRPGIHSFGPTPRRAAAHPMLSAAPPVSREAVIKRCAIYTRKSHAEGLEQPFNSLEAQRAACSHYIASQASDGWCELDGRYDDGGFSGGSLDRPALVRLLEQVASGAIDIVVVYKIDRLSRSLRDFVRLMEAFERRTVTFVSVTQQFSTTSSMGRLTLNMLLSFAQFEREITSERTRDKFSALRERGVWTNGVRPYGYQLAERQLVVDAAEAAVVRRIHHLYARLRSAIPIAGLLNAEGLRTHRGTPFNESFVRRILKNRLYRGERAHRGHPYPGAHRPIVSERVWARTEAIKEASPARRGEKRAKRVGLLTGLLFSHGQLLRHVSGRTRGKLYRYYELAGRPAPTEGGRVERFRALELERAVLAALDPEARLRSGTDNMSEASDFIRFLVERIDLGREIVIALKTGRSVHAPVVGRTDTLDPGRRGRDGRFWTPFEAEPETKEPSSPRTARTIDGAETTTPRSSRGVLIV